VAALSFSPDGKTLAAVLMDQQQRQTKIALFDLGSSSAPRMLDASRPSSVRFTSDGRSVVYATRENGVDNLWRQPLDGSPGKQLTSFNAERIADFHWSFDGSKLAMVRGHSDSDVVLIRSQQP